MRPGKRRQPPDGSPALSRAFGLSMVLGLALWGCVAHSGPAETGVGPEQSGQSAVARDPFYQQLDAAAAGIAAQTVQTVLETRPSGAALAWRRGDAQGTAEALRTFKTRAGVFCREYRERLLTKSPSDRQTVACRTAAGVWLPTEKK